MPGSSPFNAAAFIEAISGTQGGVIALWCTLPIETVQKTQTMQKVPLPALVTARQLLKERGMAALWAGGPVLSCMVAVEKFLYFLIHSGLKASIEGDRPGTLSSAASIAIGYVADLGCRPACCPLELLAMRMVTQKGVPRGVGAVARDLYNEEGLAGFYKGASSYLALAFKPAVQQAIFDQVKIRWLASSGRPMNSTLSFVEAFLLGCVGRFFATLLVFPFQRAKQLNQGGKKMKGGFLQQIAQMHREGGLDLMYQGCSSELVRGILFQAILMGCKETLQAGNERLLLSRHVKAAI